MKDPLELDIDPATKKVKNRETASREFKAIFDTDKLPMYARTMAAFANRNGGVIFFGIKNSPTELLGVAEKQLDDTTISNFIRAHFEPEIVFTLNDREYHGKNLLYILVEPCLKKPVICKNKRTQQTKGKPEKLLLREGAIYYRYGSSSIDIKYPELRQILDTSVRNAINDFTDTINLVNQIGPERLVVLDKKNLIGSDTKTPVYITKETADNIKWIRKGQFTESKNTGAEAINVVGETELNYAIEVEKPVDFSKTHTLILRSLADATSIKSNYIKPILWKLELLENELYHIATKHGKISLHKFTVETKNEILKHYPKDMPNRLETFKKISKEYATYKKEKRK